MPDIEIKSSSWEYPDGTDKYTEFWVDEPGFRVKASSYCYPGEENSSRLIEVVIYDDGKAQTTFTADEIEKLIPTLQQALTKARQLEKEANGNA